MIIKFLQNNSKQHKFSTPDKIITGSYHGTLRIYNPKPVKGEHGWSGFKPQDLLLETQLPQPILQVAAGRFVS